MPSKKPPPTSADAPPVDLGGELSPEPDFLRLVSDEESHDFEVLASVAERGKGAIFQSDELFLPSAVGSYRKPVAAIHAIPEKRDVTLKLSARKLMEALPLAVQLDLRARGKVAAQELVRKIREDRASPLFEIRTKELGRLAGLSVENLTRIHDTLAELVGFRFIWNALGEDGQVEYEVVAPFLIRRDRGLGPKLGYTRFAFEPEVLLWFLEPKMWANLSWSVMSGIGKDNGLGQETAFGLYQNIWRYIGTSAKVTPALDVATWIDLVLGPSRFVQVDAQGNKTVHGYKDFKRRHLVPGLAILNGLHALNHTVELREEKSGLRVTRLRFKFSPKVQEVFDFPLGWPPAILKALEELGYESEDISTLSQLYPYPQVAEALKRLPGAEQRIHQSGSRVHSRKAFFQGILGNIAKGEVIDSEVEAKIARDAELAERKEREKSRSLALAEKFAQHQQALIAAEVAALAEDVREALFREHWAAKPAHQRLYSPGPLRGGYLALLKQWLLEAKPQLVEAWLPEEKDREFQSWLIWQLSQQTQS